MNEVSGGGWLVDASVALKWFRPPGVEPDADLARGLIGSPVKATTLAFFEVGSVLSRTPGASPSLVGESLQAMLRICGPPLDLDATDFGPCAHLAEKHGITFYDASYVAIANRLRRRVVTADRDLLGPGLAVDLQTAARG